MSQFDFPRFNFNGHCFVDPGTANNNYYNPLCIYDPVECTALTPPRLYISERFLKNKKDLATLNSLIPAASLVQTDSIGNDFIEILTINTNEIFKTWCVTPLGTSQFDKEYHPLYTLLCSPKSRKPIEKECPAYWNYHGKMTFGFTDVKIESVEVWNDDKKDKYTPENVGEFEEIFGSELSIDDQLGTKTGAMIDVCPSMSVYSQTFCDSIQLKKGNKTWFKGRPTKGSLRLMNPYQIVNQDSICGASGTFYQVVPLSDLEEQHQGMLELMKKFSDSSKELSGLFIRYTLLEVVEDREPDYAVLGENSNPAKCTILGSISPWYAGELKTITAARQLLGVDQFISYKKFSPFLARFDDDKKIVSLDLLGNIPELNLDVDESGKDPKHFPQRYETYNLGTLDIGLLLDNKFLSISTLELNETAFPRDKWHKEGAILDFTIPSDISAAAISSGDLVIYLNKNIVDKKPIVLAKESEFLITTDTPGLYADEGDNPELGYICNDGSREPCKIRIFSKGQPVNSPVKLSVLQFSVDSFGEEIDLIDLVPENIFFDGQELYFPLNKARNAVYVFYGEDELPNLSNIYADLMRTGFFISLRVLPNRRFDKFVNPAHEEYVNELTFTDLFEHIFKLYELIYPVSAKISPFNQEAFIRGEKILKRLLSIENWGSASYMPSTREMSANQRKMVFRWLDERSKN